MLSQKPLFIPLKGEFYDAFDDGSKDTEYRMYGSRWNEATCTVGRPVVLSRGYGKAHRIQGEVADFTVNPNPASIPGWTECYGDKPGIAACIRITLRRGEG